MISPLIFNYFDKINTHPHGEVVAYYLLGNQLAYKTNYFNGKKHGNHIGYDLNGSVLRKGVYVMGEEYGYWIESNEEYYYARM